MWLGAYPNNRFCCETRSSARDFVRLAKGSHLASLRCTKHRFRAFGSSSSSRTRFSFFSQQSHYSDRLLVLLLSIFPVFCLGFVPPVSSLIREALEGRKGTAIEMVLSHRVRVTAQSDPIALNERVIRARNQTFFFWKLSGSEHEWVSAWNGKEYRFPLHPPFASESKLFLRALLATTVEEMQSTLLAEQFLRKDQLIQYKPGFEFEGDPNFWKIRENFLTHPDIILKRLGETIVYSITGLIDGKNRREFMIEKNSGGFARVDWQTESGNTNWGFSKFMQSDKGGLYPSQLQFESSGVVLIQSHIDSIRFPSADQIKGLKRSFEQAIKGAIPLPENLDAALKILLSFR